MVINTNATASFSQRVLSDSTTALSKSLAKLSSGSRIVSPDDDAAGAAVSMKFRAELKRIGAVRNNVGNAMSFSSTQDGFLGTVDKSLRRMSELATLATDGTKSATDIGNYDKEFQELKAFIKASTAKTFNGTDLFAVTLDDTSIKVPNLAGTQTAVLLKASYDALNTALTAFKASVVAGTETALKDAFSDMASDYSRITNAFHAANDLYPATSAGYTAAKLFMEGSTILNKTYTTGAITTEVGIKGYIDLATDALAFIAAKYGGMKVTSASDGTQYTMKSVDLTGIKADMEDISGNLQKLTNAAAAGYVTTIGTHIGSLAGHRANIGANISRLNMTDSQLAVYYENLSAANSRIEDVDIATETSEYAKQQILVQSGTAMLSQANMLPQAALKLLQ